MKKIVTTAAAILSAAMLLSFAACSDRNDVDPISSPTPDPVVASDVPASADPTDAVPDETQPTETQPDQTPAANDFAGKPFTNDIDMAVIINGTKYPVREDSAKVLAVLGDDYDLTETISCVYVGNDKEFIYDGIKVCTVPVNDKDVIEMFVITGGDYTTARNIGVGATKDELIAAYGDKYWDDGYLTYTESGTQDDVTEMRIQFLLEDDVVTEIYVYSPSYTN